MLTKKASRVAISHMGISTSSPWVLLVHLVKPSRFQAGGLDEASTCARAIGARLSAEVGLPVYYYGAAHGTGRRLADVRRSLGERSDSVGLCSRWILYFIQAALNSCDYLAMLQILRVDVSCLTGNNLGDHRLEC